MIKILRGSEAFIAFHLPLLKLSPMAKKEQLRQQCKSAPQEEHCDCLPKKKSSAISFLHLWQIFMNVKIQAVLGNCQEAFV
jgi:hypothetical protein